MVLLGTSLRNVQRDGLTPPPATVTSVVIAV